MKITPARAAAFDVLLRVERDRAFTSVLLPSYETKLSGPDRALCHELVLGVLRRQLWLDRVIDHLAAGRKLDLEVRIALRLGLYQLRLLSKIPVYSSINESVELTRRAKKSSAAGLVNALLRRATREEIDLGYRDDIERISVEGSHPRWLVERWTAEIGPTATEQLVAANNAIPPIAFRVIRGGQDVDEAISHASPSEYVPGCYISPRSTPLLTRLADEGAIYFQDEGSQLIAGSVPIPPGGRILDVCAAPGGKTGILARSAASKDVFAGDLYFRRVGLLRENLIHQDVNDVQLVQYNAEAGLPFVGETFDTALVDAPCTGTGTIRHNPEIRYFLKPDDIDDLSQTQRRILHNAALTVKPGGHLIYSTCSLEPEENEAVCSDFLSQDPRFRRIHPAVPETFLTSEAYARTWPHRNNMDGFFIATFQNIP